MSMMTGFNSQEAQVVFRALSQHYTIIAPVKKPGGGRFSDMDILSYDKVNGFAEIEFFQKTYFSAKAIWSPLRQAMFAFRDNKIEEVEEDIPSTIIFLRSCDIHALKVLDRHFLNSNYEDVYYKRRRQKIKLFLIECEKPFKNCSCVSFQTNKTDNYAAFMRKIEDRYEIQVRDEELEAYFPHNAGNVLDPRFAQEDACPVKIPQDIDASIFENDIWKEYTQRCIACGRCTVVCPTCSCFTIQDVFLEDKSRGERKRIWSSCLVKKFSLLAGNHDFRTKEGDRLRYRVLHKMYDFRKRHGLNMCVGCGRCDDACPEYISMSKCLEKINQIIKK